MSQKSKPPIQLFAELEAEIAKFGVPPPKTWPWAMYGKRTDMALRNLQLLEFLEDLRAKANKQEPKANPQRRPFP